MAQVKKECVKEYILDSAREEFLQRGFKKASLERIADKLIISKSNIYTYYRSKDELFCHVVKETTECLDQLLKNRAQDRCTDMKKFTADAHQIMISEVARLVDMHRENLKLLIFLSQGSSLESYREKFTRQLARYEYEAYRAKAQLLNYGNKDVSEFFIYNLFASHVGLVCEVIRLNSSYEEIIEYGKEYMSFAYHGMIRLYEFNPTQVQ